MIDIAKHSRKIAHVQFRPGRDGIQMAFWRMVSWHGGFKTMIGMVIVILAGGLLIPCPISLLIQSCNRVHRGSCPTEDGHLCCCF